MTMDSTPCESPAFRDIVVRRLFLDMIDDETGSGALVHLVAGKRKSGRAARARRTPSRVRTQLKHSLTNRVPAPISSRSAFDQEHYADDKYAFRDG
jgi:hypothetical protein